MKNSTKLLSGTFALAIVAIATTSSAFAYRGDISVKGPNYSPERHAIIESAFENNDYNAWIEQMEGRGRVIQVVNADNFSLFAEAHRLAKEGKFDEAKAIRTELGLGLRNGNGQGRGLGRSDSRGQGLQDGSGKGQKKGFGRGNR
ncbi:hypothetical protein KAI58_01075 [Candidatus Gracilibacteria bacterium]|nr:hypothetical protein [Candidatus Gracilibacteria bacterium]